MLAKKYRLPSSFFKKIEKEKTRSRSGLASALFSVKIYFSPMDYSRFAAVAPGSIFKKSVLRNKARRGVYEAVRKSGLYRQKNIDCILYLKKNILDASQEIIESELKKILK